jgi:ATP-dependent Zn protease
MLKAMRRFFLNAKKNAPCIAFIDEFDSFGDRAVRSDSTNYDYKRQVINALLECLDPSEGRTGVVVVGATNSASQIDPALLRPGRLERVVNISLPDLDARIAILRHHLPSETDEISFVDVGADTEGWSGADIEKLARDAKRYCRRRGGDLVSQVDIKAALPTFQRLTEEERMRVAVHEAGHALLSVALDPGNLVKVRVGRHKLVGEAELGTTTFNREAGLLETEQQLTDRVVVLLGGMVAEGIVFGDHSTGAGGGRDSDLARATGLATMMESAFGFGEFLASDPEVDLASLQKLRMSHRDIARKVDARLSACRNRAREILSQQKVALLSVARDLVAHGELEADAVVHLASLELAGDGVERSVIARTQVLI